MGQTAHFFPVALLLEGRTCLVVGSSDEAAKRARALREAGARVRVVAEAPSSSLRELLSRETSIEHRAEPYAASHLDGVWLAVLADRDQALAERLAEDCGERRLFHCGVDQPERSSFAHVGVARAGALQVAIGTDGKAPALARRLKAELERVFAESKLADFVELVTKARAAASAEERARVTNALANRLHLRGSLTIDED